ncbi:MAG: ABC transporter ATP-binding protein [bacterium]|nr:ABC transporter ATP-binding protein [bacterium]
MHIPINSGPSGSGGHSGRQAGLSDGGPATLVDSQAAAADLESNEAATTPLALEVADLGKNFRSGLLCRRIRGIEGVSFNVRRGEIFALIGHNGAGKTTTINCLLKLCRPDTGRVRILGRNHAERDARARVGYLPERPYFFEHLSGRELLRFYGKLLNLSGADLDVQVDRVLAQVGMTTAADRRLRQISKGMLQRIGLAQALLGDPELLILDEPMSGLDPIGRREVRELLRDLRSRGRTILLSSHIVPDVEMLADAVGILRGGRLVKSCERREIAAGASYMVHARAPGEDPQRWPTWLREAKPEQSGVALRIPAPDTTVLRGLLSSCHQDGMAVGSVETRHTGLEDLYLAVHEQGVRS